MSFCVRESARAWPNIAPSVLGFAILLVLGVIFILSGDSIPVTPHDQLDFVVPLSELRARHIGDSFFPEIMGGMPSSAATIAIPGMEILYFFFPGVLAFSLNLVFVVLVAYCSLHACLVVFGVRYWVAAVASFMFALLPFYSVYALSSMGVPLMVYAIAKVLKTDEFLIPTLLTILYGVCSSLIWVGYAVCFLLCLTLGVLLCKRLWRKSLKILALLLILLLVYIAANYETIIGVLFSDVIGHRVEFSTEPEPFSLGKALVFFASGQYHAVSNHRVIMWLMIVSALCMTVRVVLSKRGLSHPSDDVMHLYRIMLILLLSAFVVAIFREFFTSDLGVGIRSCLPKTFQSLQVDRFYWLYPTIWYFGAGITFEFLLRIAQQKHLAFAGILVILLTAVMTLSISLPTNDLYKNVQNKMTGKTASMTWQQFFSESLFEEIGEDLDAREGGTRASYRVVSVGLHPYVALHNGFYTLDGYSVDYPLEYKHAFAKIVEPELDLSPSLHDYFWNWGSRCYVFSHECDADFLLGKDSGKEINDLEIDVEALKTLGGKYVFSALPINNAESIGLQLINKYSNDDSYYEVWVYEAI